MHTERHYIYTLVFPPCQYELQKLRHFRPNFAGLCKKCGLRRAVLFGFAFAQQMNTTAAQPQEPVVKEVIRIKCPNCGELNKEDAKFCCECGTSLITKKYCPQCGGEVETDSKFCSTCGQKL